MALTTGKARSRGPSNTIGTDHSHHSSPHLFLFPNNLLAPFSTTDNSLLYVMGEMIADTSLSSSLQKRAFSLISKYKGLMEELHMALLGFVSILGPATLSSLYCSWIISRESPSLGCRPALWSGRVRTLGLEKKQPS